MRKVLSILAVFFVVLFIVSCSATTAHIDNVQMCSSITDNQCSSDVSNFTTITPELFISCKLKNASENTDVNFAWFYHGQQKIAIDQVTMSSGNNIGTLNLQASLSKPTNGWPQGEYEVIISIVGFEKDVVKSFSVQ